MTTPHTATTEITCPWCGYKWTPTKLTLHKWELWECYPHNPCSKCGKDYDIEMHVVRTYTTKKVEEG